METVKTFTKKESKNHEKSITVSTRNIKQQMFSDHKTCFLSIKSAY